MLSPVQVNMAIEYYFGQSKYLLQGIIMACKQRKTIIKDKTVFAHQVYHGSKTYASFYYASRTPTFIMLVVL